MKKFLGYDDDGAPHFSHEDAVSHNRMRGFMESVQIRKCCPICQLSETRDVDLEQWQVWEHTQDAVVAFPAMSRADRAWIKGGFCGECFELMHDLIEM